MSEYHWSCLEKHKDTIEKNAFDIPFLFSTKKIYKNWSIKLPDDLERVIVSWSSDLCDVLCFFDDDLTILNYSHRITCIHPKHSSILSYLAHENPKKWFWWKIDASNHLCLPIDTLQKIRIVKEVCISVIDNFSWSIMAAEQEKLFYDIYSHKLNTWEISVPKELLDGFKDSTK